MTFIPSSGSVVAFQSDPTKLVATVSVVGNVFVGGSVLSVGNQSVSGTIQADIRGSVATVIIGGSIAASFTPPANQSVSGTVGASIIGLTPVAVTNTPSISGTVQVGNFPTNQNVSGSVVAFQGTSPWVVAPNNSSMVTISQGSVATVIIGGSIAASFTPPANQSVSGTVGASIIGLPPFVLGGSTNASVITVGTAAPNQSVSGTVQVDVRGSVAVAIISGSIAASFTPPANQSVSGTVNIGTGGPVSVMGTMSVLGTVPVTQSTSPWIITGSIQGTTANQSVSGTVVVSSLLSMPAIVSSANSTTTPVTSTLSFTGTGEEWKDFGSIVINVFTDASSGTDGLSIQQSSDNSNWDIRDTYTISSMAAGQGKTFQVQPAARFGRIVYTQGAVNSGAFRLQTLYHPQMVKPTSQRAMDGYSNETDLEQVQNFGMLYNGVNWDRWRGNSSVGAMVFGSVVAVQGTTPWVETLSNSSVITVFQAASIVGTYAEDAASASGDRGLLVMGARNDTLSSVTSTDGDYSSHVVGPAGELIAANSPFTKWVSGTGSMLGGTPVTGSLVPIIAAQGASIFTYITGLQIANASGTNAWVTLLGGTNSVIGYTIAPANGGSNIYYQNGLKTNANAAFSASVSAVSSVYVSAQGFISKT